MTTKQQKYCRRCKHFKSENGLCGRYSDRVVSEVLEHCQEMGRREFIPIKNL